jgi:D-threonate/D-erythronate kinase
MLLILSDDLSGAADCAAACMAGGLSAQVSLTGQRLNPRADIVAIDLNSRHLSASEASMAHDTAVQSLHADRHTILYKKIDSTLRGHIGIEIAACLAALPNRPLSIVAPAFPGTGRTTRNGRAYVGNIPLEATELWRGECGRTNADLTDILREAGLNPVLADLDLVRCGAVKLHARLEAWMAGGVDAVVCDAEAEQDLGAIATAALRLRRRPLFAGSAGLARHVKRLQALRVPDRSPAPKFCGLGNRSVLTIIGSMSAVSQEQARRLASTRCDCVRIAKDVLNGGNLVARQEIERRLASSLAAASDVIIVLEKPEGDRPRRGAGVAEALAQLVCPHARDLGALILTGGETARAVLAAMGVAALSLVGELEPGVALGITEGDQELAVVIKAGAFGNPDTLVRAHAALRSWPPSGILQRI